MVCPSDSTMPALCTFLVLLALHLEVVVRYGINGRAMRHWHAVPCASAIGSGLCGNDKIIIVSLACGKAHGVDGCQLSNHRVACQPLGCLGLCHVIKSMLFC